MDTMPIETPRLWRNRLKNGLQTLLIMGALALVLAVPGYLLAGGFGVLVSLGFVVAGAFASSWVPARYILANGALILPIPEAVHAENVAQQAFEPRVRGGLAHESLRAWSDIGAF